MAKTALVTGSDGFIGRNIVRYLLAKNYSVQHVDLPNMINKYDALYVYSTNFSQKFDIIFHCAYNIGGRVAIETKRQFLAKNLMLDASLFDWVRSTKQPRVVYFSSSAAYPIEYQNNVCDGEYEILCDEFRPCARHGGCSLLYENDIDLTDVLQPDADYGWAKLNGEKLAANAKEFTNVHVFRPFSGYGEDQSTDYPFPSIVDRALRKENPLEVWGTGEQVRDWIHIDDIIGAVFAAIECDYQEPLNLCTGIPTTIRELASMCAKEVGYSPEIVTILDAPTGVPHRVGSTTKLREIYKPKISLPEGINRAVKYRKGMFS